MPWGEQHGLWKGNAASDHTKRQRARRLFSTGPCERCGATHKTERHHKDGNPGNNVPENIAILCRRCHQEVDGRLAIATARIVASSQARAASAVRTCANCGRIYKPLRRGRCSPCYRYWSKYGKDIGRSRQRKRLSAGERTA